MTHHNRSRPVTTFTIALETRAVITSFSKSKNISKSRAIEQIVLEWLALQQNKDYLKQQLEMENKSLKEQNERLKALVTELQSFADELVQQQQNSPNQTK